MPSASQGPSSAALRRTRAGAGAFLALLLAACGASTPRQAAVEDAAAPVVAPNDPESSAEPSRDERRGSRRAERRVGAADEAGEDSAADAVLEPVPEPAAQAHARAVAALRAENWVEAELELEQLVLDYPQYPGPHVNLAILYRRDGRDADARAALERALAIDPGHPIANDELGILLREQGEFDEAEHAYRRAIATDPDYALAHYNLAVLLDLYLRRQEEALEHYEIYQSSLAEPDQNVARWIIDLRRRLGIPDAARVAQEDGA